MPFEQTLLIVDDVSANITVLAAGLSEKYNIRQASSGADCIKQAQIAPQPDLILLDIVMPEMDGYETCRQLKSNPKTQSIPVIFVTQKDQPSEELLGLELGAMDYITKPIDPVIVAARVKTQLMLKRQTDKLANSEAMLRAILDNSPLLIATKDLNGNITTTNRQFTLLEGEAPDNYIGKNITSLYPEDSIEQVIKSENLAQTQRVELEESLTHQDGSNHTYLSIKFPITNAEEELLATGMVSADITNRKKAESSLRQAKKMDAIGQLTGGIAHDFNNILGIISGNIELLESNIELNEKNRKRVENMRNATERAADLTSQLLGFSQVKPTRAKVVNLKNLINNTEQLISQSLTHKIKVVEQFDDNLWSTKIDCDDFQDAFLNLVLNAQDAMPDGGELRLTLDNCVLDDKFCSHNSGARQGQYIHLSVTDNGKGIPQENLDNIFNPFFTTKLIGKGTGLGLSMVFGFIKRSGGYIRVDSKVGEGTAIHLYLPKDKNQPAAKTSPQELNPAQEFGKETILLVDDEIALLDLSKGILESVGYHVLTASNGKQALRVLKEQDNIALLVTDVIMPGGVNGNQLAEHCQLNYPEIKILLCSGFDNTDHKDESEKMHPMLDKPYGLAELAQKVKAIIASD